MIRFPLFLALSIGACPLAMTTVRAQNVPDYEQPPISYSAATPQDAVATVQRRIASGVLAFVGDDREIVRAVLRELDVPLESQVVVFSKTSLQRGRISPSRPRALYFSDTAYVGWVPGGLIEITTIDPRLGPIFYSFDPQEARGAARTFVRDSDCLRCHGDTFVRGVPGVFARSLVPNATGEPLLRHGTEIVDDETPFENRWGGWYVTGYTGSQNHRGNAFGSEQDDRLVFDLSDKRPADLSDFFDTSRYLTATSDVVALLVFEHQMAVQNSLTRAAHSTRKMLEYQRELQKPLRDPQTDEPAYDSVKSVFNGAVESVLDHLLFRHAAPLPAGVTGAENFRRVFVGRSPRSEAGDALKDFQLRDRIFKNRCSFLIYSEMFAELPIQLKNRILDRLHAALHDDDPRGRYAYLEKDEKRRIYEILLATLPAAKARWAGLTRKQSAQ